MPASRRDNTSIQQSKELETMRKCRKRKSRPSGKDVLKCFHCGGDLDGRSQADLWYLLVELDQILYCDKCVDEHNRKVAVTGRAQRMTVPYAPNGLVEFMAYKWGEEVPQVCHKQSIGNSRYAVMRDGSRVSLS